jgi:hypothetical protein
VELNVPLLDGLALTIGDRSAGGGGYPTRRLQKGLLLVDQAEELAEEGVGFGVPVLKCGVQTIFPGAVELTSRRAGGDCVVTAVFDMNLVERLVRPGGAPLRSQTLYAAKNVLAALHRRSPALRGSLTATSNALRRTFGWATTFEEAERVASLTMVYVVHADEGRVGVSLEPADAPLAGVPEIVVMNEQGARHFDRYEDADGTALRGDEIGTWDQVTAARASFVCAARGVAFSLEPVDGAELARGRELIGSRVAWSGFGYSFPPTLGRFGYDLLIERIG